MWKKALWLIPIAVLAVVLYLWKGRNIFSTFKTEFKVIDEITRARKDAIRIGAEKAASIVEFRFTRAMEGLSDAQKKRADELRRDPAKLSAFLVRTAAESRERSDL